MINNVFIPNDAYQLQKQVAYATECSHSEYFMDRHFFATAHATAAVALAIINCPLYLIRAVGDFIVNAAQLNFIQMGEDLRDDLLGFSQSLMMSALGTFYVFAGLFFPESVFGFFTTTPRTAAPIITYQQFAQEHQDLENAQGQIRLINDEVQDLTDQLRQARVEIQTSHGSLSSSQGRIHDLEQFIQGLNDQIDALRADLASERTIPPSLQAKIAQLEQELSQARADLASGADPTALTQEVDELKRQLKYRTDHTEPSLRQAIDDVVLEKDKAKAETIRVRTELGTTSGHLLQRTAELGMARRETADLQRKYDALVLDQADVVAEGLRLTKELNAARQTERDLQEEIGPLKLLLANLIKEREEMGTELDAANATIKLFEENSGVPTGTLRADLRYSARFITAQREGRKERGENLKRMESLREKNRKLREDVDVRVIHQEMVNAELARTQAANRQLEEQVAALTKQLADAGIAVAV